MLAGSPSIAERGSFIKINQSNSAKKRYLKAFFSPIYSSRYEPSSSQMMSASRESSDSLKITVMTPLDSEYPEPLHSVWKSAKKCLIFEKLPNYAHIRFDYQLICQIELAFFEVQNVVKFTFCTKYNFSFMYVQNVSIK